MQIRENWKVRNQMIVTELHLFSGKVPVPGAPEDSSILSRDSSRKQRVLVVDDEQLIAQSLRDILSRAGFDTVCALSGTEAIELAAEVCPDIVISDVIMPNLDGVQTAIRIRRACPDTIVFWTSCNLRLARES